MLLVGKSMQTKEIAAELGMSPGRVDKQIQAAREKLGGISRREAGRLVREWVTKVQGSEGGYCLGAQSLPLSPPVHFTPNAAVDHDGNTPDQAGDTFADQQAAYSFSSMPPDRFELVPLRHSGRQSNDLSPARILATVAKLTFGALALVGSAVSLLSGLTFLARH